MRPSSRTGLFQRPSHPARWGMRGAGVIRMLLFIPVALMLLLILAVTYFEGRKAYWDYRVREMCAKDGGVTVIEPVAISFSQAATLPEVNGLYGVSPESLAKPEEPVFSRTKQTMLREDKPLVFRYEQEIVRRSDGKVVAKAVTYARGGGDVPSFAFPSSLYCPEQARLHADIHQIFKIGETK